MPDQQHAPLSEERLAAIEAYIALMDPVGNDRAAMEHPTYRVPVFTRTYEDYRDLVAEVRRLRMVMGSNYLGSKMEIARLRELLRTWNEHLPGCAKWVHQVEQVGQAYVCEGEDILDDTKACTCGWDAVERELAGEKGDG